MRLSIAYDFLPKRRSLNTSFVMDHFGIDFEQGRHVVAENVELHPRPGDVVLFSGPSGSGKSSLLRAAADRLAAEGQLVTWTDRLPLPERPLVDVLPTPIEQSLDLLAACGLGEAQLMLRTPAELSDGQRYRFRLALGVAHLTMIQKRAPASGGEAARWLAADEFSAALDRTLAKVLAFNLHRLSRRAGIGFLLATTHEDIVGDLQPDVQVRCEGDGGLSVVAREPSIAVGSEPREEERRRVSFFPSCGSVKAPVPTGRISQGGIIAATTCAWSGG